MLGVLLAASVLAQLFLAERNRHADNVYSPRLAWMRALLYFSVILVISWATGVLKVLVHAPFVQSGDLASSLWLVLTGVWLLALVWGYVYWWPRGTLTYDRRLYLLPQILFGLAWGFSSGQLTLVLWAVIEEFGFARWGTALLVFFVLAGYGQIYQSGWWDIHVSPPHNIRATNAKKGAVRPHAIPRHRARALHAVRQCAAVRRISCGGAGLFGGCHAFPAVLGKGWSGGVEGNRARGLKLPFRYPGWRESPDGRARCARAALPGMSAGPAIFRPMISEST